MENAKWVKVASGAYNLVEDGATVAMVRKEGRHATGSYCEWTYTVGDLWGVVATMRGGKRAVSRLRKGLRVDRD